ncbi:tyrosine-type recombinase/integrase [Sphingomonas colocasiae]|uniref:Site-specific integrase n=1 Tax=Sphingomonas colocasiae TaxID=1848973 RepID=A0ABS7PRE4_9SPHN|nr:site-specific integrase [Sphingomonas colocasiae]MBY8823843.1 site-specific integrase [Sphingomonas colocasiae]
MARHRFTEKWIWARKAPRTGRVSHSDILCPGLQLRISESDVRSFSALVRVEGRLRRYTLGQFPRLSLRDARRQTLELWRAADEGSLPAPAPVQARLRPVETSPPKARTVAVTSLITYAQMIERYVELHAKPNTRSWRAIDAGLRHAAVQHFMPLPAEEITRRQIIDVLDGLVMAGTPYAAITVRKYLAMAYRWAHDREMISVNPAERIRPPAKNIDRDRVLTDAELGAVWRATFRMGDPYGQLIRCLILLGQRRTETASLRWSHIVGDEWHLAQTKNGRPHLVPLPPLVMETLASLPRHGDDAFVFTTDGGATFSCGYSKAKQELDRLSGVSNFRLHDLRRTMRSGLARLGVTASVCRKIIGHSEGRIDRIYDRYDALAERREGLERWEQHVVRVVGA